MLLCLANVLRTDYDTLLCWLGSVSDPAIAKGEADCCDHADVDAPYQNAGAEHQMGMLNMTETSPTSSEEMFSVQNAIRQGYEFFDEFEEAEIKVEKAFKALLTWVLVEDGTVKKQYN